jgi:hypothetical protein
MDGPQAQQRQIRLKMTFGIHIGPACRRGLFYARKDTYLPVRKVSPMPKIHLAVLLLCVLIAAAGTVWLLSLGGSGLLAAALPAFLFAALAIRYLT